jgi:two-component system, LuxR family, response regulator FixJ
MTPSEKISSEVVCLVDDDPAVLKAISRLLASDGLSVRAFNEPNGFLAHVEDNAVPLVILDIWMEQRNGLEVQAQLSGLSPPTRVIVITGRDDHTAEIAARECGAIGYFIKPFDDEQFLATVRKALQGVESK